MAATYGQKKVVQFFIEFYQFEPSNKHIDYTPTLRLLEEKAKTDKNYQVIVDIIRNAEEENCYNQHSRPNPMAQTYENLVLSGGGGKGFIFPAALQALEHCLKQRSLLINPVNPDLVPCSLKAIKRVAGTSAGAMFAFALALGFSPSELKDKLAQNFGEFLEDEHLEALVNQLGTNSLEQSIMAFLEKLNIHIKTLKGDCRASQSKSIP